MILEKLEELQAHMNEIAGDWNGEDSQFNHDGVTYDEQEAQMAIDIATKAKELAVLIEEFEEK